MSNQQPFATLCLTTLMLMLRSHDDDDYDDDDDDGDDDDDYFVEKDGESMDGNGKEWILDEDNLKWIAMMK